VSLLDNWQAEHKRHIGSSPSAFVDIVKAYGSDLPRRAPGRDIETGAAMLNIDEMIVDRFGYPTCVLTTYETLRDYQQSFASVQFALVVLDEAQRVSALNSDFWLALTGTPVENRLADLWAIADILEPSFLGSLKSFSKQYESGFDEESLKKLKLLIEKSEDGAPFMLRRLKEQVLDGIPQKHEHLHPLPMPEVQSAAYNDIVSSAHDKTAPKQMLAIVQQLRETSLHPLKPLDCSPETYIAASARFQSLFRILDEIRDQGEKVLIFLDRNVIEAYLARLILQRYELPELPPIINGDVPGSKRQLLVDGFQKRSGFGVMILSPKAGGVGLTLTAANHVIHLSRWWNPAVEDQSTDRVYRIGQQKPVHVHYVQAILPGQPGQSFDERLHLLLQKKRRMSRDLLWPFDSEASDAAELLGK
jgi:SNF2 family DNA or RNA helicase